jgi:uncharacterized RDD family membrane protein YckC
VTDFSKPDDRQYPPAPGAPQPNAPAGYPPASPPPPGPPFVDHAVFPYLPPGVQPASHGRRIGAYFLSILLVVVTLVIGYVIWGLVLWGKGTSPALRLLGMRCVDEKTGRPATFGKMALRDIVGGIVQGIAGAITGLVSFILFLATAKRQTLPDLIGSTIVVHDPSRVLD